MINFLIFITLALAVIAFAQLIRVYELSTILRGEKYEIKDKDNRMQGNLMILFLISFMAFCIWQVVKYKDKLLPPSGSEHGDELDWLLNFNIIIISIVFVITHILLFYFAFKYRGSKERKAHFYPHNNTLELIWTTVPAVVLFIIIFLGLNAWNAITAPADEKSMVVELYAKQFDWTARYAGQDNALGDANYKLISGNNPLGMDSLDQKGFDDVIVRNEIHIPKGKEVSFKFRSRDVIHSAYFPHFRSQMNCVPGMETMFHFVPKYTTAEMQQITGNPDFQYILLCNKICGASHYNMQMTIVVDEEEAYQQWLSGQQPVKAVAQTPASAAPAEAPADSVKQDSTAKQLSALTPSK